MSDSVSEPSCVYWIVPSPLSNSEPLFGPLIIAIDVRSRPSSISKSESVTRSVVVIPPSATESVSSPATGRSLTAVTSTVNVCITSSIVSETVTVMTAVPLASATGV